ncbi:hypothetical protein JN11_03636 [Mucilaginibacter frigoritolerans]|uniref:Uncharacterized protein n=1 Tax=Mucilaginibacter frigoritolerans TaxID=652788 RepID=A0A562TVR7_9SPHI|nr:hypothetical protein JN11_03636 [Mucilaginibacter frigoritolerans]
MIKLYVFYFVFGFYMLFESYAIWVFRAFNDGDAVITYMALISSAILFSIASGLLIYHPKNGLLVGIVTLIGVFPFGIRWLIYRYTVEGPIIRGTENQIILLATAMYAIGLFYSIKRLITYKYPGDVVIMKRPFKLFLTFFPASLLFILIVLTFINP